ncbi:hypothetical protein GGX14DRAFT_568153 [Mycena pura]|uniref:Cyanovirin-N domain-containing protein n=1 Tax=Mycena pura TaxID=153505 RepID=A0AAD6YF62_9AGAR|nr:hypothetical protein GGX14DRAFT_568153 [Mycena pura]
MKIILSSSLVLGFYAVVSFGGPFDAQTGPEPRAANAQFLETCSNTMVDTQTAVLTSTCDNLTGGMVPSSIPLDSCLMNANGQLAAGGDFSATCGDIKFLGVIGNTAILAAVCDAHDPCNNATTSIDLSGSHVGLIEEGLSAFQKHVAKCKKTLEDRLGRKERIDDVDSDWLDGPANLVNEQQALAAARLGPTRREALKGSGLCWQDGSNYKPDALLGDFGQQMQPEETKMVNASITQFFARL